MPSGACVIRYGAPRCHVADQVPRRRWPQMMETVGAERDGVTRKQAEAELRERLVRVDRRATEAEAADVRQYAEHGSRRASVARVETEDDPASTATRSRTTSCRRSARPG